MAIGMNRGMLLNLPLQENKQRARQTTGINPNAPRSGMLPPQPPERPSIQQPIQRQQPTTKVPVQTMGGIKSPVVPPLGQQAETSAGAPQGMFTFIEGRERPKGHAQSNLYEQTTDPEQVGVEELRSYFNDPQKTNRLPEVFGTFDNYLAYMNEREELLRSGNYDIGNWSESLEGVTTEQQLILAGEDIYRDVTTGQDAGTAKRFKRDAQEDAYTRWINSDVNQALMEKYGVAPTVYSDSGDKFQWNGTAYVKTEDVENVKGTDYFKAAVLAGIGYGLGTWASQLIPTGGAAATSAATTGATGATGAAGAAGATGGAAGTAAGATAGTAATATTAGTFLQGATQGVISSAFSQGASTGSIDGSKLLTAGILGGIGGVAKGIEKGTLTGTKASDAIADLATTTGLTVKQTTSLVEGVIKGTITGDDVTDLVMGAVEGFTVGQLQNALTKAFGDELDIPNLFDKDTTTIPIESLNPFIETAVGAAFEGRLDETDVLKALYDYSQEGGSFEFLDPTKLDLPESPFETPDWVEDIRAAGRNFEDAVRNVVRPIGEVATAVGQPIGDVLADFEDRIKEAMPQGTTPDVDLPEGPDIDLSLSMLGGGMLGGGGGGVAAPIRQGEYANLMDYQLQPLLELIEQRPLTASEQLDQLIRRNS